MVAKISQIKNKRTRARFIKIQQAQTRKILANNYSVFEPATCEKGVMMFGKDCKPNSITSAAAEAIGRIESKWSIMLYIMVREKNGKNKLEVTPVEIHTPCKHSDIRSQIADAHWEWIKSYQWQDCILTAGWIAAALGNEPTIEEAYKMFDHLGVWKDLIAEWEDKAA